MVFDGRPQAASRKPQAGRCFLMSDRIYYTNAQCTEFDATVTAVTRLHERPAVALDATAFYPTSGGQPFDTGTLGDARVVDVIESEAGDVWHVLDRGIEAGRRVHGTIDWERRFDHMQQHTGQHILSAAFDRLSRARTVGFHLGALVSTVDLSIDLVAGAIDEGETEANRIVWEDRPVGIRLVAEAEAAALPLRKEPGRSGALRVVDVQGYDLSACGGTHVSRTGAVGLIAVLSAERLRGGVRLEFVCGTRALRSLRTFRDAVSACIRHVSVAPEELPAALERLQAENREQRKAVKDLQEHLSGYEAAALAAAAEVANGVRRVVQALEGRDQNALKTMALAICSTPGFQAALFTSTAPYTAVLARSKDGKTDCAAALKSLMAAFGGRGGGKPELALGGGLTGDLSGILAAARAELQRV
jgi:alanyl-tRNA synthetase